MFDIETTESDLDIDGKRVDVYRNLNEDCLSIKSRDTDSDDYGTVIGHADLVLLSDVEFIIQESGQEKTRETGTKNVHAVVRGTVEGVDADGEVEWNLMVRMFGNDLCNVHYDPFETDTFEIMDAVRTEGDTVEEALYASVTEAGVGAMFASEDGGDPSPGGAGMALHGRPEPSRVFRL